MKKRRIIFGVLLLTAFLGFFFTSCEGPMGPQGRNGEQGLMVRLEPKVIQG